MSLDLRDCTFVGPAMPEPFVKFQLEDQLAKKKLLPKASGPEAKALQERWDVFRRKLRNLGETGGEVRVRSHVLEPLVELLGWSHYDRAENVVTREGAEDGGHLLRVPPASGEGQAPHLRAWVVPIDTDLDAPNKRGRAYRYSPSLIAQRVLLTRGERVALMTDGLELRILLSDPSGRDSHIRVDLCGNDGWKRRKDVPDSFRLLKALCQPAGVAIVGDLLNEARLAQSSVTKKLREQARRAVEQFLQGILDDPANAEARKEWTDLNATSKLLWREGLVLVYRLLFILKLESSPDPARAFSFASTSLWRNSYSPSTALAPVVADVRGKGAETGEFLASSLRALFRLFSHGMQSSELNVSALGGVLFGKEAMPILDGLHWSEQAVALLLDALLWTPPDRRRGQDSGGRERVHYGSLDVEDLGRVYEALLELDPGITSESMCRLRRAKLEVVVPLAQGAPYRKNAASEDDESDDDENDEEEESSGKGRTKIAYIEEIPAGRFYLRVGLGRKATGSYYTPHAFVRFLVHETLGPQVKARSPQEDPNPLKILELNVLDPAMGSGHFLVEACRFLGNALYEACRLCDERALRERELAESSKSETEKQKHHARALELWQRVVDLPDPNDELVAYLPSRILDADEGGLSQRKALALCRRLVAVHCLYGVDKNPLAVELAKVSLWLESYAEGLPLTFLDHRLICGDSLMGPFLEHLFTFPGSGKPVETNMDAGLNERLHAALEKALQHVRDLEMSVGKDVADLELKETAKTRLDEELAPFRLLAAAWAGGVMLGDRSDDEGYHAIVRATAGEKTSQSAILNRRPALNRMVESGRHCVAYDLLFPEVFHPDASRTRTGGFDVVVGNPPWDKVRDEVRESDQTRSPALLLGRERGRVGVTESLPAADRHEGQDTSLIRRLADRLNTSFGLPKPVAAGDVDLFHLFALRSHVCTAKSGSVGLLLPGGFAKNPSDAPLRAHLATQRTTRVLLHFVNKHFLFEELPQVAEFAAVHYAAFDPCADLSIAFDLEAFPQDSEKSGWQTVSGARAHRCLTERGSFLDCAAPANAVADTRNLLSFLETGEKLVIANDLHRTGAESALASTQSVIGERDARIPEVAARLRRQGYIPCYSGRSIAQFNSLPVERSGKWDPAVDLVARLADPAVVTLLSRVLYFRLAIRSTCGSPKTNQRSVIACVLPCSAITSNSLWAEGEPASRPYVSMLVAACVLNSFVVDSMARPRIISNFNKAIMAAVPSCNVHPQSRSFLAHAATRLSCVSSDFLPLIHDQLGSRHQVGPHQIQWPLVRDEAERWSIRANIDAVVADAYGLDRDQYRHVLSSFSHKSYPKAPELCLAAFDELKQMGLDAFCKKHDPYWDIPLVTTLPKPVIDLPVGKAQQEDTAGFQLTAPETKPKRGRGRKGAG